MDVRSAVVGTEHSNPRWGTWFAWHLHSGGQVRSRVSTHRTLPSDIQRLFGYKPRTTEEQLRVAQALERLPQLDQALHQGVVNWSTVRKLTRVTTADDEGAWVGCAQGRTLREVEQLVAGRRWGPLGFAVLRTAWPRESGSSSAAGGTGPLCGAELRQRSGPGPKVVFDFASGPANELEVIAFVHDPTGSRG